MAVFPRFGPPKQRAAWEKQEKAKAAAAAAAAAATANRVNEVQNSFGGKADDALEKLTSRFAEIEGNKKQATLVSGIKNGKVIGKVLSSGTARSMPSSPALNGVSSPSLGPSGYMTDKQKRQRMPIIHELAVVPRRQSYLFEKFEQAQLGNRHEFNIMLSKVAIQGRDEDANLWSLKQRVWKDLDIYNYAYASKEERQTAIKKAIAVYDKLQLGRNEPEWEKLLPKEERGTGKCLSIVQARRAQNVAGGTSMQSTAKAERSSGSPESASAKESDRTAKKQSGEAMIRSNSQPVGAKTKKVSEREAQAKRLLSNSKKPAQQKATTPKPSTPKVSPAKPAQKGSNGKGPRILSKEFITDSDEEDDDEDVPLSNKNAPKPKVTEKPKAAASTAPAAATATVPAPLKAKHTVARPTVLAKPEVTALSKKRVREEDDNDSSSSGTPLSKRLKPKEQKTAEQKHAGKKATEPVLRAAAPVPAPVKNRPSDSSQNSRTSTTSATTTTSSGTSYQKSKNTSPAKSSPLASSPPTNASDLEPLRDSIVAKASTVPTSTTAKRKADDPADKIKDKDANGAKRQRLLGVSDDIIDMAKRYRAYYPKYKKMHNELVNHVNPPADQVEDLLEMRERLQKMKAEIYREVAPV